MLYFYPATDSDNKYSWKNFYKYLDNITEYLETLASLSKKQQINQTINKCKKVLESDTTIKKEIFDKIEQQLSSVSLFREKIEKIKRYIILS